MNQQLRLVRKGKKIGKNNCSSITLTIDQT